LGSVFLEKGKTMADSSSTYTIRLAGGVDPGVFSSIMQLKEEVARLGEGFKSAAEFFGIGLGVHELIDLGKEAIEAATGMGHLAQEIGIGVESLSKLKYAADLNEAGEHFRQGMLKFSTAIAESNTQGTQAQKVFQAMGIKTAELGDKLKPTEQLLFEVADKFAGWADGANKARIAEDLFGTRNAQFISVLNQGSEAIKEQGERLKNLHGVITENDVLKAEDLARAMVDLHKEIEGLTRSVAVGLIPELTALVKSMSDVRGEGTAAVPVFGAITEGIRLLSMGIVESGGLLKWFGTILGQLPVAAWETMKGNFSNASAVMKQLNADLEKQKEERFAAINELRNPIPSIVPLADRLRQPGGENGKPPAPSLDKDPLVDMWEQALEAERAGAKQDLEDTKLRIQGSEDLLKLATLKAEIEHPSTAGEKRDAELIQLQKESDLLDAEIKQLQLRKALLTDPEAKDSYDKMIAELGHQKAGFAEKALTIQSQADPRSIAQSLTALMVQFREQTQNVGTAIVQMTQNVKSAFSSVGDSIGDLITHTKTFGQVWATAGQQAITAITKMVAEYVAGKLAMMAVDAFASKKTAANNAAGLATSIPAGISQAGAEGGWAGILIYIGVFAAAMAAITALAAGVSGGFESGGYTGSGGISAPAGTVHGQEYVLNAPATAYYGADFLDRMNRQEVNFKAPGAAQSGRSTAAGATVNFARDIRNRQDEREFAGKEGFKIMTDQLRKRGNKVSI
jgi:hypothetical protein